LGGIFADPPGASAKAGRVAVLRTSPGNENGNFSISRGRLKLAEKLKTDESHFWPEFFNFIDK
jgi:hypothetical protein